MPANFTRIASLVVAELNANTTYATASTDPRFYTSQIRDAIVQADIEIWEMLLSDPNSPYRQNAYTPVTVAHAAQIPPHIGPPGSVVLNGKGAEVWSKAEIENERLDVLLLGNFQPHYVIDQNDRLFHNYNGNATIDIIPLPTADAGNPPTLFSPEGFGNAILVRTLAILFSVEGENTEVASHYERMWEAIIDAIKSGKPLPQ